MKDSIQGVAYLLRKTSLTLAEIREGLDIGQFQELFAEVAYQEAVDDYQQASYMANLLAAIANTVPRKSQKTYDAAYFLKDTKPPRRIGPDGVVLNDKEELELLAKRFGIKLPGREIRDL